MNFREAQEIARKAKADGSFKMPANKLADRMEKYSQAKMNRELAHLITRNEKARTIKSGPMLSRQPMPKIKRGL